MSETETTDRNKYILLGVLLVGGVGYFGYEYVYRPRAEEITALESRLETLQLQNQTARILVERDGEGEVERRLEVYRDQLVRVEGLIPSSEELPELLDAISVEAQRAGVELSLIQPAEAVAEDYYTRRIYSLGVLGGYHQIGQFLTRVASLPRIITPTNLNIAVREEVARNGDPLLEAMFAIETYVLPSFAGVGGRGETDGVSQANGPAPAASENANPGAATQDRETAPDEVSAAGTASADERMRRLSTAVATTNGNTHAL